MDKEIFKKPEMEIIEIDTDVICTSGCDCNNELVEIEG